MKEEKDTLPFVLKTIAGEDESRLRGLDQLADIIEIAYALFQDKILIDEFGDPFVRIMEQKSVYENFNRALIETIIAENRFYAKVDFNGTFITVDSRSIENSLKDLEVIWLVVQGIRIENGSGETEAIIVPAEAKKRMLAKLSAILQYFLSTSSDLIAKLRIRQLEEKLVELSDGQKKAFLLRYKTDLQKKDHGIKKVHEALIKVIDLELDLIKELSEGVAPQVPVSTKEVEGSFVLPVGIDKDFLYELSIFYFPFKAVVENDPILLAALKQQFSQLESKPKLHWYFNQFITDKEWEDNCTRVNELSRTNSKEIVAARFIPTSDTERRANEIIREFNGMIIKDSVDPKYFGRLLKDTAMVKTLGLVEEKISELKQYVFHDANVDNYKTYAKASAKAILSDLSKLEEPSLKQSILEELLGLSIETDIGLAIHFFGEHKNDHAEMSRRFKILKLLADEYFAEALEGLNREAIRPLEPAARKISMFDRIKRELDVVAAIYKSQYFRSEEGELLGGISVLDKDGRSRIDGQYIQHMDIFSDVDLLNIQEFKRHITERYEATTNHVLLLNQLKEIRLKAAATIDFYNKWLTSGNQIVDDFLKDHGRPIKERIQESEKYHALVFVSGHFVTSIALGVEIGDYKHSPHRNLPFRYSANNQFLATLCQQILDFIHLFELGEPIASKAKTSVDLLPENLFKDSSKSNLYLSVLKTVQPPVVDQEGNYILGERKKGAVVAWVDVLLSLGKIDQKLSRQQRTDLVNRLVPGLNITLKSLFGSTGGSQQHYINEFEKTLKEI